MCARVEAAKAGRRNAVVRQLHVAVVVNQDVASLQPGAVRSEMLRCTCARARARLDVAVDVAVAVEIAERLEHGVDYGGDDRLLQALYGAACAQRRRMTAGPARARGRTPPAAGRAR